MLKINSQIINLKHLKDNTVDIPADFSLICREQTIAMIESETYPQSITKNADIQIYWKFEGYDELFALIYLKHKIDNSGNYNVFLEMPYMPYSKRHYNKLKCFASIINDLHFSEVKIYDPYSEISKLLIDRVRVIHPQYIIDDIKKDIKNQNGLKLSDKVLCYYPDIEEMTKYDKGKETCIWGIPEKKFVDNMKILNLNIMGAIPEIGDSTVLMIDNFYDKEGIFYESALKLKKFGAKKVYLYISHCQNTIIDSKLVSDDAIEHIYTTNSLFTGSHKKITVFNV